MGRPSKGGSMSPMSQQRWPCVRTAERPGGAAAQRADGGAPGEENGGAERRGGHATRRRKWQGGAAWRICGEVARRPGGDAAGRSGDQAEMRRGGQATKQRKQRGGVTWRICGGAKKGMSDPLRLLWSHREETETFAFAVDGKKKPSQEFFPEAEPDCCGSVVILNRP
ncbi:hypothetical protein GUJ93_ZPchr0013g34617 [Zizania palustris]|uniref:Uncharacterized protein n=1 Tax=Zizania palustris TaxID=103762 RepID=A0A8J5X9W5_ZIZPA|nr:hypothetical protein GUJ93_ZPchr0013g34617 [Zizania palustris]